jgi:hypothetical protein
MGEGLTAFIGHWDLVIGHFYWGKAFFPRNIPEKVLPTS